MRDLQRGLVPKPMRKKIVLNVKIAAGLILPNWAFNDAACKQPLRSYWLARYDCVNTNVWLGGFRLKL